LTPPRGRRDESGDTQETGPSITTTTLPLPLAGSHRSSTSSSSLSIDSHSSDSASSSSLSNLVTPLDGDDQVTASSFPRPPSSSIPTLPYLSSLNPVPL
jgi:hypothetical protein